MSVTPRTTHVPSLLKVFGLIALMDATARTRGFGGALTLAKRLGGQDVRSGADSHSSSLIDEITNKVVMAAAFYPRRALCLEQSLALFVMLRRRGVDAQLKVGVLPLPFSAHAWVEVDGRAINEKQGHIEQLVTFQHVSI